MKSLFLLLLLTVPCFATKTLTSSVAFTDPQGNILANGSVIFKLANGDRLKTGGQLVQGLTVPVTLTAGGMMPGGAVINANDEMQSSGNYYIVTVYNANGTPVRGPENWIISGASPIDLALETNVNLPDPGLGNPVLQNPTGTQTIAGQPLILAVSAPLTANGGANLGGSNVTNAVLTSALSGNAVGLLNVQGPSGAITGTGTDLNIFQYLIPANTIGAGKGIRIKYGFVKTNTAGTTYKFSFGGSAFTIVGGTTTAGQVNGEIDVFNAAGVTNSQIGYVFPMAQGSTLVGSQDVSFAVNTTGTVQLVITFSCANTDSVTPKFWLVELIQ